MWFAMSATQVADFGISRVKDPTKSYLSATNNNGTPMCAAFPWLPPCTPA